MEICALVLHLSSESSIERIRWQSASKGGHLVALNLSATGEGLPVALSSTRSYRGFSRLAEIRRDWLKRLYLAEIRIVWRDEYFWKWEIDGFMIWRSTNWWRESCWWLAGDSQALVKGLWYLTTVLPFRNSDGLCYGYREAVVRWCMRDFFSLAKDITQTISSATKARE